jgi:hypothetical protein
LTNKKKDEVNFRFSRLFCCRRLSLAGTQNVKKICGSLQKYKKKNNKSTRTHPAYQQSWDTLKRLTLYLNVFSRADASGIHATS